MNDIFQFITTIAAIACGVLLTDARNRLMRIEIMIGQHAERIARLEATRLT